jgi:hypothetical protein
VLSFERQVVGALMSPALDPSARAAVESYVSESLHAMPEYLRAGVIAESLVFGAGTRLRRGNDAGLRARIDGWKTSRIDFVRQYVRLLQSLVLFAENELAPSAP